jgi:phosphate/sulfate permease
MKKENNKDKGIGFFYLFGLSLISAMTGFGTFFYSMLLEINIFVSIFLSCMISGSINVLFYMLIKEYEKNER